MPAEGVARGAEAGARQGRQESAKEGALDSPFAETAVDAEFAGSADVTQKPGEGEAKTKAELDAYIANLEEKLATVGDDAQLANADLQSVLQKQQQTLQACPPSRRCCTTPPWRFCVRSAASLPARECGHAS